jgi:PmbA protein
MANEIDLATIAEMTIAAAIAAGADEAEAYVERTRVTRVRRIGRRTASHSYIEEGIGLRVLAGGRAGFFALPGANLGQLGALPRRAVGGARPESGRAHPVLPEPAATAPPAEAFALVDPALVAATIAEKSTILARAEEACHAGARLARADFQYEDRVSETHLASTRGVRVATEAAKVGLSGQAIPRADRTAIARARVTTRRLADLATAGLGPLLATRAAGIAGARPAPAGRLTLVLPPDLAADLLAALAVALSADRVARQESFLANRLGRRIGNDLLNVIDDGTLPGGLASAPCDDEGTPTAYHHPVVGGRLAGWLSDATSAAALGLRSTGNAMRTGYRMPPAIRPRNLILTPGCRTPEEIVAGIEHGLLVHEAERTAFAAASGRYLLRVAGQLVTHGQPGRAVRATVTGLLPEMLMNLAALGHDLVFTSLVAAPTVAVAGVSVTPVA